jgi:TolA-binding protein
LRHHPAHSPQRAAPAPVVYRSKRRVLRRLVIPGALAAIIVGGAIGVAASYVTSQMHTGASRRPATHARSAAQTGTTTRPATTAASPSQKPSTGASRSATAPGARVAEGQLLNDQGYARIQQGEYRAAIPPLQRAVADLRGAGPANPYEAYANYNLGYALLQVGDCTGALVPLEVANRLETSPLVDDAIRRASACANQGS